MKLSDFDFELPPDLIALRPAVPRDTSKLLIVDAKSGQITDAVFNQLPNFLKSDDVLVFNTSKTIPAALNGVRPKRDEFSNNVKITINLHKKIDNLNWKAFIKPAKRVRVGDIVEIADDFSTTIVEKYENGEVLLRFNCQIADFYKKLEHYGQMPIPPYIGQFRETDDKDKQDYQTIYAQKDGSVATPTAGLHFTEDVFAKLDELGVMRHTITLHVGAGTFLPVKTDNIEDHKMHSEWFEISSETANALNQAKREGRRIICVGTTSLRALESSLNQNGEIVPQTQETSIFLFPGKKVRFVDGLISNFHLPKSTLLMLMSAFCSIEIVKKAYKHAINTKYRFFSYGDCGLWWRQY